MMVDSKATTGPPLARAFCTAGEIINRDALGSAWKHRRWRNEETIMKEEEIKVKKKNDRVELFFFLRMPEILFSFQTPWCQFDVLEFWVVYKYPLREWTHHG